VIALIQNPIEHYHRVQTSCLKIRRYSLYSQAKVR